VKRGLATEAKGTSALGDEEFCAEKALGTEATAQALLARSLLAQGKVPGAQRTLEAAFVAAEHTQNHQVVFRPHPKTAHTWREGLLHCCMFNFGKPKSAGDWIVHIAGAIVALFLVWFMLRMYVL